VADESQLPEIKLDPKDLYREDTFTDRRAGMLRRLVPVDAQGKDDPGRPVVFEGHASLMTQGGALPLRFEIDAASIEEALEKFPAYAQQALIETVEELQRLQREAQSSILVPGRGGPGPGGPAGMPGGGRIKL
jgi:hypothetical protein